MKRGGGEFGIVLNGDGSKPREGQDADSLCEEWKGTRRHPYRIQWGRRVGTLGGLERKKILRLIQAKGKNCKRERSVHLMGQGL